MREKDVLFNKIGSENERNEAIHALSTVQDEINKPENLAWKQEGSQSIDLQVLNQIKQAIEQKKNSHTRCLLHQIQTFTIAFP